MLVKSSNISTKKSSMKFTDSQIVLYWICKPNIQLKKWVRNRVNEINRLTSTIQWNYVQSKDRTRRCVSIEEVDQTSIWTSGHPWMLKPESTFPAMTIEDIKLSNKDLNEAQQECNPKEEATYFAAHLDTTFVSEVQKRYCHSNYLIDPNTHKFSTFCVPLVDKFSPIAISLTNEIHWNDPTSNHSGNETTWR